MRIIRTKLAHLEFLYFLVWLVLMVLALRTWTAGWRGVVEDHHVTSNSEGADTHHFRVRTPHGEQLEDPEGFRPSNRLLERGTKLAKIPGEFFIREDTHIRSTAPTWCEYGILDPLTGLFLQLAFSLAMARMAAGAACQWRIDETGGCLFHEPHVFLGRAWGTERIPITPRIRFACRTRVVENDGDTTIHHEVHLERPGMQEVLIASRPTDSEARGILKDLQDFRARVVGGRMRAIQEQALAGGVKLGELTLVRDLRGSTCKVCGDGMRAPVWICQRCETPHHRDCWQYAGGCSTFACEDRRA